MARISIQQRAQIVCRVEAEATYRQPPSHPQPITVNKSNNKLRNSILGNLKYPKAREVRNTILNSPDMKMTDKELQDCISVFDNMLSDSHFLVAHPDAVQTRIMLTKILNDQINITTEDERHIRALREMELEKTGALAEIQTEKKEAMDAVKKELKETKIFEDTIDFDNIDQQYVVAYLDALKEGEEITNTIRVNIIGNAGVGKSTLTRNLLGMVFDPYIESTDGIDLHVHKCCDNGDWSSKAKVDSNDERTAERIALSSVDLQSKTQEIEKPIENSKSVRPFSNTENITIDELLKNMPAAGQSGMDQSMLLSDDSISKKQNYNIEPKQDVLSDKKDKEMVHKFSLKLKEKGSTSEKVIQIWDFGGQFIYYATHQLFHSRRAVYLLVLDASNELNDTVEKCEFTHCSEKDVQYFCRFWMHSIHSFVGNDRDEPPVILVATHTDTKPGWNKEKQTEFFGSVRNLFDESRVGYHIQPEYFAINNTSKDSSEIETLRKYIVKVAKSQDSWNSKVPARWIPLEDSMNMRKPEKQITLLEVKAIGAKLKVPITDDVQIKSFLRYHNALGNLIYFDDEGLSEFVILDPQWIIDAFKAIITANANGYCQNRGPLRKHWTQLTQEAILTNELLN